MWLFTIYGFFSVANASDYSGPLGEKWAPLDPDTLMIRARDPQHLQNLIDRFVPLKDAKIEMTEGRDYCCRIIIPKLLWLVVVETMANEQNWSNFKSQVAKNPAHIASGYEHALHDVWGTMFDYQLQTRSCDGPR
jgi:hypothetical protein